PARPRAGRRHHRHRPRDRPPRPARRPGRARRPTAVRPARRPRHGRRNARPVRAARPASRLRRGAVPPHGRTLPEDRGGSIRRLDHLGERMTTSTIHLPAAEVPVIGEYDVVIVGGGPAGLLAATAASRAGRSTLLI